MRYVIWTFFGLAFPVLTVFLLLPLEGRGVSWDEASWGIIPGAIAAFICFVLLLAGIGVKDNSHSSRVWRFWLGALLWSLLIGGIVTAVTSGDKKAELGSIYGWATLGFAVISLLGLIISLTLKKTVPDSNPVVG